MLTFIIPQIAFVFTYFAFDELAACYVMMLLGSASFIWMTVRENGAFLFNILAKFVMSICAAVSVWYGDPAYMKLWISLFALLGVMLVLTAKVINRNIMLNYTDNAIDMTDKALRKYHAHHVYIFGVLLFLAEIARLNISMDSWIVFQMFFPSIFMWIAMIWAIVSLRDQVSFQGERLDSYINAMLEKARRESQRRK